MSNRELENLQIVADMQSREKDKSAYPAQIIWEKYKPKIVLGPLFGNLFWF